MLRTDVANGQKAGCGGFGKGENTKGQSGLVFRVSCSGKSAIKFASLFPRPARMSLSDRKIRHQLAFSFASSVRDTIVDGLHGMNRNKHRLARNTAQCTALAFTGGDWQSLQRCQGIGAKRVTVARLMGRLAEREIGSRCNGSVQGQLLNTR